MERLGRESDELEVRNLKLGWPEFNCRFYHFALPFKQVTLLSWTHFLIGKMELLTPVVVAYGIDQKIHTSV